MIIRNATFFDIPELLTLADVYVTDEVIPTGVHSAEWEPELMAHNLMESIKGQSDIVLVACEGPTLVGYLWAASHILAPWSGVKVSSDYLFYVIPSYRGTLTAMRIIKAYKEWALEQGCAEVRLSIASGIHPERTGALYEAMGFSQSGVVYNLKQ
jgi:GNAT superfamily N-acetyltransferase